MIRKGLVYNLGGHDTQLQTAFAASLFQSAA
jgi:hypothetical protein